MIDAPLDTVAWRATSGIEYMTWPILDDLDVDVVMTTRFGGVSRGPYRSLNLGLHVGDDDDLVLRNRDLAAGLVGARLDDMVFCNQTHGRGVLVVTEEDRGRGTRSTVTAPEGIDVMVTAVPGPVIAMMVADCAPIALYDPRRHIAAVVHSGWRGTVVRVAEAAVRSMVGLGTSPGDLIAVIGPAADPEQYRVGPEVMEAVSKCFAGEISDVMRPLGGGYGGGGYGGGGYSGGGTDTGSGGERGAYLLDLWEANRRILVEAGLRADSITSAGIPTGGDGPFFSHRSEQPCGRNAILVKLRPRP